MGNAKYLKYIIAIIFICTLLSGKAYASDIKSNDLIDRAKEYDGKTVTFTGEVIGDIMKKGDYAWVNVNDGDNAIGIWVPYDSVKNITYTGSYGFKGDLIKIEGVFSRACIEHGGDLDIHSEKVEILKKGSETIRPVESKKLYVALGLAFTAMVLMYLAYTKRI